jgi:hypothetical protein
MRRINDGDQRSADDPADNGKFEVESCFPNMCIFPLDVKIF